ncbi:GNAT family N-acetyltransferase [Nocardioides panaciterrulae]|uniref:RimJ/RimL family protein N-acetyltransferase n=1 Tax=Nocardioides panaciterrulae TaxID=661492 RepID=A0A7Y9E4K3_9ACTN|nr:GNAT family N-acetyltransferase [Nocardioides panaciterrulae]NYD40835.1 RimJ/RimL family protein N-acetyltransferase [Nocardioides panaciterrulae]
MTAAPTLTDGTVTIRGHRDSDAEGSYEQCLDPLSRRWTTVPLDNTLEDSRRFVTEVMPQGWADDSEWGFAVEVAGRYAGTISLRNEGHDRAEIAYGSHPWVRGSGAMERALRLLLEWGFAERGLHTVVWRANKGNWASRKVAWRLGFSFEGTLRSWLPQRGELRDAWVGTLLRDDPRAPRTTWLTVPVLEADGLRLRPWREADVPRIVEACSDAETQRWLGDLPSPYDEGSARWWLEHSTERRARGEAMGWAVVDPTDDLALASVSVFDWTPGVELEVGYWAHPAARGRRVTTRAVAEVVRHAFEELKVNRVKLFAATDNLASRRVIEHNGFRFTGIERLGTVVRDGYADVALYDLLAGEYAAARR